MNIISTSGNGSFKLMDEHREIINLKYTNWFLGKAETYYERQKIEIKPRGLFNSSAVIVKHAKKIGEITMSWNGKMKINLENDLGKKRNFVLERTGFWKSDFTLKNESDQIVLTFQANNNWRKLNSNYQIGSMLTDENFDNHELLIYCGYAINLAIALSS
ncbi:hypothetical protein [Algoriphagus sp.]|uniref:hypothetical protein n=1 Tax=Algoriphagus sp. TaxID=1872435 RepID=UPI0025EA7FB9|nr:hypothetical protein [Algoriphagus sp.]